RDREQAKAWARDQAAKLGTGTAELTAGRTTLAHVFALYEQHRTPRKSAGEQSEDGRRIEMWARVLGGQKDPHLVSLGEWEGFIDARRSGAITGRGVPVMKEEDRELVRDGTVAADCIWLRQVLGWATRWREGNGPYVMRENPVRGFEVPEVQNVRRPMVTTTRYEKLRAVSDRVLMDVRRDGKRGRARSYLSELLDLAYHTGRRVGAILPLRYHDLRLAKTKGAPHGAIQWPGETDKMGKAWYAPLNAEARAAVDRVLAQRPGIGAAYLFPRPDDASKEVSYDTASDWLVKAEGLASLPKQDGSLWHASRRGWVTARKHWPLIDTARAGGWDGTETLARCYAQDDDATILRVVTEPAEVREVEA
ncbi:MAG TPA: hypothetical protein VLB49_15940, partial [Gemmatimonadales bacterium]|nr:hypothetical protein [Gemmatimonadales bacterium]